MLQGGAVARRLPILQIQHGHLASDSIGMPVAAWLLGECLLHWAMRWRAPEVGALPDETLSLQKNQILYFRGFISDRTVLQQKE